MAETIEYIYYLKFRKGAKSWNNPVPQIFTKEPKANAGEVVVKYSCKIPAYLFTKPAFEVELSIDGSPYNVKDINSVMKKDIIETVQTNLGITLKLIDKK